MCGCFAIPRRTLAVLSILRVGVEIIKHEKWRQISGDPLQPVSAIVRSDKVCTIDIGANVGGLDERQIVSRHCLNESK